jgi:hypothetical protein
MQLPTACGAEKVAIELEKLRNQMIFLFCED